MVHILRLDADDAPGRVRLLGVVRVPLRRVLLPDLLPAVQDDVEEGGGRGRHQGLGEEADLWGWGCRHPIDSFKRRKASRDGDVTWPPHQHGQLLLRPRLVGGPQEAVVLRGDGRGARGEAREVGHEDVLAEGRVPVVERGVLLVVGVDPGLEIAGACAWWVVVDVWS